MTRAPLSLCVLALGALAPSAGTRAAPSELREADAAALERVLSQAQARLESRARLLEDHSSWERAWEIPTREYLVRTSLNWYIGKRLGDDLDAMLDNFRQLARTEWQPPEPLRVFLFPTLPEYNAWGAEHGAHHSSLLGGFWAGDQPERPVAVCFEANALQASMWATHAAFHQFAEQALPRIPETWLGEGLASYFGIYYWDPAWGTAEFARVVASGRFVPLRQLMSESLEAYAADPGARFVELGTLIHYLLNCRPDTLTQKSEDGTVLAAPAESYLSDLLRGRDVTGNPVHALMTRDMQALEAELRAYDFGG